MNSLNEINITYENKNYLIFFSEKDTIETLSKKIKSIDEKIQLVNFHKSNSNDLKIGDLFEENIPIDNIISDSFYIIINKHLITYYIPSLYKELFSLNSNLINKGKNINENKHNQLNQIDKNCEFPEDIEEIKNEILLNLYTLKTNQNNENKEKISKQNFEEILNILKKREEIFVNLNLLENKKEKMYENLLKSRINLIGKFGITFGATNFFAFYLLIFKFYSWDVIEPITYIVGNIYWILSLGALVFYNKKVDFSLIEGKSLKDIYADRIAKNFSFDKNQKKLIENEIEKIKNLKNSLENFI
jgi:hypothetical protein